jgi:DNA-binding transcriptional LysR family regulator
MSDGGAAFDALMREQNMTMAGGSLGLTQPAMSRAIQRLRLIYDDPLFVRTARGMRPTEFAKLLAEPVGNALTASRKVIEFDENFVPATSSRAFRIAMTDVAATFYLPSLIPYLKQSAPHVTIQSIQVPREKYAEALEVGTAELAIGQLPRTKSLQKQRLVNSTFVCMMRKNHPRIGNTLSMKQFMEAQHITVTAPARADEMIRRGLGRRADQRHVALSVPYYLVVPSILSKCDLIAVLPQSVAGLALEWRLKVLPLPFTVPMIPMGQFWHPRSQHDPGHRWLRDTIARMAEWLPTKVKNSMAT